MKKILIYGDSNTWGDNFITGERIPDDKQWPHILEANIKGYKILQEGLPGRIAGDYEDIKKYKNGKDSFLSTFRVNAPVDIVIIALGTNDLQFFYNLDEEITENGLTSLIKILKNANPEIKIIIIPPVKIKENIINGRFSFQFDLTSVEKVHQVFHIFKKVAEKENCYYLDLNEFVTPSEIDGLHFSKSSHKLIAEKLAELIKEIFKN